MTDTTWHDDLTASVHALGAAARELRAAHDNARHASRAVDPARLVPLPGLLSTSDDEPVRPHDEALWQLTDLYAALEQHTGELYANAASGYSHGAAQALAAVLRAERPHRVTLPRDADGTYALPGDLPDLAASLTTAAGSHELAERHARVRTASGTDLADAATAYGEQAERTLTHLIRFAADRGFLHAR